MTNKKSHLFEKARDAHLSQTTSTSLDEKIIAGFHKTSSRSLVPIFATGLVMLLIITFLGLNFINRKSDKLTDVSSLTQTSTQKVAEIDIKQKKQSKVKPQITKVILPTKISPKIMVDSEKVNFNSKKLNKTFYVSSMIKGEFLSSSGSLEKINVSKAQLISGKVRFTVAHNKGPTPFTLIVKGNQIKVVGTVFTVACLKSSVEVFLEKGKIKLISKKGKIRILKPGDKVVLVDSPVVNKYSLSYIRSQLASFRNQKKHSKAAKYLKNVLPHLKSSSSRGPLLIDLASIQGAYLHNWDAACNSLKQYKKQFPNGKFMKTVSLLWVRYRCN